MRAVLSLEIIGDNFLWANKNRRFLRNLHLKEEIQLLRYGRRELRPWVARLLAVDEGGHIQRAFVTGMRDYSFANTVGSRGIYEYFALEDGLYEVNEAIKLGKTRRYFISVRNTLIEEISWEEAMRCLTNDTSESAS